MTGESNGTDPRGRLMERLPSTILYEKNISLDVYGYVTNNLEYEQEKNLLSGH